MTPCRDDVQAVLVVADEIAQLVAYLACHLGRWACFIGELPWAVFVFDVIALHRNIVELAVSILGIPREALALLPLGTCVCADCVAADICGGEVVEAIVPGVPANFVTLSPSRCS